MDFISLKHKVIGMYLSDYGDVYNNSGRKSFIGDEFSNYIPILNLFHINNQEEIKFVDGANKDREIVTYNRTVSTQRLSDTVVKRKKLNVTHNDLLVSPINIFLNFTQFNISVSVKNEFRKVFLPIHNDNLEMFKGKVIILSMHTLNTPKMIQDISGYSNYIETLLDKFKIKTNEELNEIKDIYTYVLEKWRDTKIMDTMSISNTIKVVSLVELDESALLASKEHTVFINNRDMNISLNNIVEMAEHPSTSSSLLSNKDLQAALTANSFNCYIVDNHDAIGDRYINIAGTVKKISKTKNAGMVNGLYLMHRSSAPGVQNEVVCKLSDLDQNEYVYKSIEEANAGANLREQYRDNLETAKNELEALKIEKANESLQLKSQYEHKLREQELIHERRMNEMKIQLEDRKRVNEKSKFKHEEKSLKSKGRLENKKQRYEKIKYKRDNRQQEVKATYEEKSLSQQSTIETLKTIGAVAGIIAGGFVFYQKFIKQTEGK